jgi:hypothetical protein
MEVFYIKFVVLNKPYAYILCGICYVMYVIVLCYDMYQLHDEPFVSEDSIWPLWKVRILLNQCELKFHWPDTFYSLILALDFFRNLFCSFGDENFGQTDQREISIMQVVFWVVTPRSDVVGYRRFGGPYCLHLQISLSIMRSFQVFRAKEA